MVRALLVSVVTAALIVSACGSSDPVVDSSAVVQESDPLDVQGHRGARGLRPENTLPSFEIALDLGVTTLELDVHFTSDGEVVVWHDPEIDPEKCGLALGAPSDVPDPDDPLVDPQDLMIRSLDVDRLGWFQCDRNPDPGRFADQVPNSSDLAGDSYAIVTLASLFDFVAAYADSDAKTMEQRTTAAEVRFNIETKRRPDEPETIGDGFDGVTAGPFEIELLRVVGEYGLADRVVIQSFDHRSLWAVHGVDTSIALAALSTRPIDLAAVASRGASIWSPSYQAITPSQIQSAHDAGLLVIPWTVNDPSDIQRLIDLGVDGLITDRPDILVPMASVG